MPPRLYVSLLSGIVCCYAATPATITEAAKPKPVWWSLQPVIRPDVPAPRSASSNPIDAFVALEYKQKGLRPVGSADKETLLRRIYYDLLGIPPTPAEQKAFLEDNSPGAYDKVVDRLLANEQHGVRWARHWLDVLRYSDLDGVDGSVMPASSGIYLWRDWVISALNHDMPYDQFVRAQILGNRYREHSSLSATGHRMKVEPNPADQFALGFLARSALTRDNKGQDIAISAVETVSTAFMGMTVGCAKCHDHKFDPIKQTDFYAMKALFDPLVLKKTVLATPAQVFDNGQRMEEYNARKAPIEEAIEKLTAPYRKKLYDERVSMLTADVQAIIRKDERDRTAPEQKIADDYFPVLRIDPSKIREVMPPEDRAKYEELSKSESALGEAPQPLATFWTVEEDPERLKEKSYVLTTGDPARPEKDKPVEPGFPFQPEKTNFRDGRRETFVDWLTAADNPLFARVAVNRIWQWHFGKGLQAASSDFGLLGGQPSDRRLLDYLSAEFVAHNYSMKWLHRLILTSDTYKLASKVDPAAFAASQKADPNDTYLWHFRLQRLEAEPIWDSILYEAGDLDLGVGGKSFQLVVPDKKQSIFVPPGHVFDSHTNRRGIYIARGYIPSTDVMSNFLLAFDVDDGRTPCPLRNQTVTAPQALFGMNDDLVEKESARFAGRLLEESGGNLHAAVDLAYRTTLGRAPTPAELDNALSNVDNRPESMKEFVWRLFNLDEFLYLR